MVNTPLMSQSSIGPPAINIEIRENKSKSTSEKERILQKNTQLMGVPVSTYKSLLAVVVCSGSSLDPLTIRCANLTSDLSALLRAACLAATELGSFPSKEWPAKF